MRTIENIFADISAHQIKGLMVHSQLADYYRFLGLTKYAECHEEHYEKETCSWRKLSRYYIEHHNKLIEEQPIENPDIIPADWRNASRHDVDTSTKRRAVENGIKEWVNWERKTKELYESAFADLLSLGEGAAAMRVKKCMCDVDYELAEAERYWLNKKAVDYDISHIIGEQSERSGD